MILVISNNNINLIKIKKKLVKQSKIITQQPKTSIKPNIFDLKSVTLKHHKTHLYLGYASTYIVKTMNLKILNLQLKLK